VYSHLLSTLRQTFLSSDLHSRLQAAQEQPREPLAVSPAYGSDEAGADPRGPASTAAGFEQGEPYELSRSAPDRQSVAAWFQPAPASGSVSIPDSVGRALPPEWSRSLPGRFEFAAGDDFDEFTTPAPAAESAQTISRSAASPVPTPGDGQTENPPAPVAVADIELAGATLKAIQVHDSYLIAETKDGMMVIDQHALHERILYEELRRRVAEGKVESQGLLVPEPVHLPADEAAIVLEHRESLMQLGLDVEEFGGDTVLVRSIPVMLTHMAPERLVRDLAEHLHSHALPPTRDGLVAELLHMVACKAAVKAGDRLSAEEITALLERRHLVADSHHCPHGRPTALVFTKAELEKQFGRI
jgi:DNA mismatch repair protein MutL